MGHLTWSDVMALILPLRYCYCYLRWMDNMRFWRLCPDLWLDRKIPSLIWLAGVVTSSDPGPSLIIPSLGSRSDQGPATSAHLTSGWLCLSATIMNQGFRLRFVRNFSKIIPYGLFPWPKMNIQLKWRVSMIILLTLLISHSKIFEQLLGWGRHLCK